MLHGVTRLHSGVRYSLFVVDKDNGLGEKDVFGLDANYVRRVLSNHVHHSVPADGAEDVTRGSTLSVTFDDSSRWSGLPIPVAALRVRPETPGVTTFDAVKHTLSFVPAAAEPLMPNTDYTFTVARPAPIARRALCKRALSQGRRASHRHSERA